MNIEQALADACQRIAASESARLDAELLLCHVLKKSRTFLMTWPDKSLSESETEAFAQLLSRRAQGEPVAYLLGTQAFWTLDLEVTPDTLIPRPETELLVELALQALPATPAKVVDLGTGTGAIALALASERPGWQLTGCDRIPAAVELAERNRERLGIRNADFVCGSWCEPLSGIYDMIVSNPPYIDPQDEHLSQGDVRFEPRSALVADNNGMSDIETIADQARAHLVAGGWLMFEHGYDQGDLSRTVLQAMGYTDVRTEQDLGQRDRVTLGRWPG